MRECNNCGENVYILCDGHNEYRVICEDCENEHSLKADSMDEAIGAWTKMELNASCEYCPLGWEERSHESYCYDFGCMVAEDIEWCKKPYAERAEKVTRRNGTYKYFTYHLIGDLYD